MSLAEPAIRQMLADGESVAVEFKIKAPRPAELAERICGMANGRGGTLLIGIADATGEVVGLEKPNDAIDIVLRAARTVKPPVTLVAPGAEVCLLDGRPIVVAQVPLNDGELYQAGGVCWIRRGTHTVPMTTTEIAEHMNATGALRWETQLCPNTRLDHLDAALLERYLAFRTERSRLNLRHTPQEELLLGLNCAARDPQTGDVRPTNVGVLMFGYDPQFHIPQSEVVCVRYKDSLGAGKYVDRKIISGSPWS